MRRPSRATSQGFDFGRLFARVFLFFLTVLGASAVVVPFLFQLPRVRTAIERKVVSAVKDQTGLDISARIDRPLWPPGIVLRDVRVGSTDPKRPFATVREARVTVRPFAMLSGRVVVDLVEVDGLTVDAEMREGEPIPTNLPLHLPPRPPSGRG